MNPTQKKQGATMTEKIENYAEEKAHSVGQTLESANEKVAEIKDRAEAGYRSKVSPAIDSAQVEVASASRYLQEASIDDFLQDLKGFASRHPLINTAVSAVVGWKIGRALVIKSAK